jgi:DNA-binding NarL/FixJ family response regulator
MNPITVLLADDHMVVLEGLRVLLGAKRDIAVVGEAQTGRQAVRLAGELLPDVIVIDIAMPLLNGLEATRQILKTRPAARVLILSAHGDDAHVDQAIELGAAGYLLKQTSAQVLSKAIREVHKGGKFFSPSISARLAERRQGSLQAATRPGTKQSAVLTSREVEVLQLIAEGKANKQTAAELGISIKTVEKHRQRLMSKVNIHDTAGLTRYAIATGIIENDALLTIE